MKKFILRNRLFKRNKPFIYGGALFFMLAGPAQSLEQNPPPQSTNSEQNSQEEKQNTDLLYKLSVLRDREVRNSQGEKLGRVSELVLDQSGQVKYAVLSHNEKMTAVPWDALEIAEKGKYYILDVSQEELSNAPTFTEENWPTQAQWNPSIVSSSYQESTAHQMDSNSRNSISL